MRNRYCPTARGILRGMIIGNVVAVVVVAVLLLTSCTTLQDLGGNNAKASALQALVTTTRSAVLLMTAAGIAYDAGAFGEPGSPRAEETWDKIAAQSLQLHAALSAWSGAVKDSKDAAPHIAIAQQALAVIAALLPSKPKAEIEPQVYHARIERLANPLTFRTHALVGGAR